MSAEPMKDALAWLRKEFPDARLYDVRVDIRFTERVTEEVESTVYWYVQVDNDRGSGDSLKQAGDELRKKLEFKATVPGRAERIAAVLREVSRRGFERSDVLDAAQRILDSEEQGNR